MRLWPAYLGLALLVPGSGAWAQVGLQLEAGLDGKIRSGRWAPFRVTATNSGVPVTGRVEVVLSDARTALPLELPTAANKRVETTVLSQSVQGYYRVTPASATAVFSVERRQIASTSARVEVVPDTARLLVVCGEEAGGLRFLDGVTLGDAGWSLPLPQQGQLQSSVLITAHPLPTAMPAEWAGLDAADLLVMRDAAWRQLEPGQRRAVRRWVEMGGRLLLCGEDPAGFQDEEGRRLLPVQFTGPRPLLTLAAFPLPDREPIRAATGRVMTLSARALPGATVGLREAGAPLVVMRPTGFGAVLWLGFDPFRVPPERETNRRALWAFLIGRITGAEISEPAFPNLTDVAAVYGPVKTLPHFPTPSRWTLSSFGLIYVAVFGPLNIWLLRRLRRTVRAWLLMPALAVVMTGGVLAVGRAWGHARVVFHAASVLEAMAGSGTARELSYGALFSPTNRAFGMEIDDPAPTVHFLGEEGESDSTIASDRPGYRPAGGVATVTPEIREGDLSRWNQIALTLWSIQPFQVGRAADIASGVAMAFDNHLAGRVTNGTGQTLQGAYLQFHGWRYPLGELAPGAARSITAAGWKRRRMVEVTTRLNYGGAAASHASGPSAGNAGGGDDLLATAGTELRGSLERSEVLLVARLPALAPPVRIPGVVRSKAQGLDEGAILVVRKPVAPPAGFAPGNPQQERRAP